MKYIAKKNEPELFHRWKNKKNPNWLPTWDNLDTDIKQSLHRSLIEEQGHICCYCGKRISEPDSHIEHLRPQSKYPDLSLDYRNLLASCQGISNQNGQKNIKKIPCHCGHFKGNWFDENLMVSPLTKQCENRFRYLADGQITGEDKAATKTIEKLNLDVDLLRASRSKAIDAIIDNMDSLTSSDVDKLIQGFKNLNQNGYYTEFSMAIIYVLKKFINSRG